METQVGSHWLEVALLLLGGPLSYCLGCVCVWGGAAWAPGLTLSPGGRVGGQGGMKESTVNTQLRPCQRPEAPALISQAALLPLISQYGLSTAKSSTAFLGIFIFISALTPAWGNEFHELTTYRVKSDLLLLFLNVILSSVKHSPLVLVQDLMSEFMTTLPITFMIQHVIPSWPLSFQTDEPSTFSCIFTAASPFL